MVGAIMALSMNIKIYTLNVEKRLELLDKIIKMWYIGGAHGDLNNEIQMWKELY